MEEVDGELPPSSSEPRQLVSGLTSRYHSLKTSTDQLMDQLNRTAAALSELDDISKQVSAWLDTASVGDTALRGADPMALQDELARAKAVSGEATTQSYNVDRLRAALETLKAAGADDETLQARVDDLAARVTQISDKAGLRCSDIQKAIVQSQGVHDGVDSLLGWVRSAETSVNALGRPVTLDRTAITSQLHDVDSLMSDISNHSDSIAAMNTAAQSPDQRADVTDRSVIRCIEKKNNEMNLLRISFYFFTLPSSS